MRCGHMDEPLKLLMGMNPGGTCFNFNNFSDTSLPQTPIHGDVLYKGASASDNPSFMDNFSRAVSLCSLNFFVDMVFTLLLCLQSTPMLPLAVY